jgi:transcriptional regulator with XRE-family HTH domain
MVIGDRLRDLRNQKGMSQGDLEKRTGLSRCHISRFENGHTIPALQTLEKMARALEVPLYVLFYDGEVPPAVPQLANLEGPDKSLWGGAGKEQRTLNNFRRLLGQVSEDDRRILLCLASQLALRTTPKSSRAHI